MPRLSLIKTNFTAGELSPRLLARVDISRYQNGAETIYNAYSLVHGGARRRNGSRFIAEAKNATKKTRVIPFIVSKTLAFVIELGETYVRFFNPSGQITLTAQAITNITQANPAVLTYTGADTFANGDHVVVASVVGMTQVNGREFIVANLNAGANTFELQGENSTSHDAYVSGGTVAEIYEIASPWDDTELAALRYAQGANTMFNTHPSYAMRKLVRFANTSWKLSQIVFDVPPSAEIGERPNTTVTLSAVSGGAVTATAAAASFEASDVGRFIESGAGRGAITGFTSTTVVTLNIPVADAFDSVGPIAANAWKIIESPKPASLTPSAVGPVGATITLTASAASWKNSAQVTHIGSFVEINDGLVEITIFTSATVVSGVVRTALSVAAAAPADGWFLRQPIWNSIDGFPQAVGLYKQRLLAGGSSAYPNLVSASKIGEIYNFADGLDDADGFSYELQSDQVNQIEHIVSSKALLPLTFGSEWILKGGIEKAIAPTNIQADEETAYGSSPARPVRIGGEVIFVQRGGKRLRAIGYRVENDSFNAPDISILSEHIAGDGLLETAYAQEPDPLLWMTREDGLFVSMSIDRDQDVIAFAQSQTDGLVESVAVIPDAEGLVDQLWAVVVRTINGVEKRFIERFEEGLQTDCCITGVVPESAVISAVVVPAAGVFVVTVEQTAHGYSTEDIIRFSGFSPEAFNGEHQIEVLGPNNYRFILLADPGLATIVGTAAKGLAVWSVPHLEGKTVDVAADGYVAADLVTQKTVSNGKITLDRGAYSVEIGLHYGTRIVTLPPEVGTGQGTAQGNALSIHEIIVRLYKTKGGKVNGKPLPTRKFSTEPTLDQPIAEFTGDKRVENLGWGRAGSGDSPGTVTFEQDQPLPMTVLGVVTRLTVNDG